MAEGTGRTGRTGYFCISGRPAYGGSFADLELLPDEVRAVREGLGALGLTELFADEVKAKAKADGEDGDGYALSHAALRGALSDWSGSTAEDPDERGRTATLVIYATGHGHQGENEWVLVAPEHDKPLEWGAAVPPAALIAALKERTDLAQVLLVLDACGAGPGGEQTLLDTLAKARYRAVDGQFDLWVVAAARRAETARQTVFSDAFTAALRDTAVRSFEQPHLNLAKVMESVQKALSRTSQKARIVAGHEDPHCRTLPNPLFMPSEPPVGLPAAWSRSSRGVRDQDAPGWYFTGREAALRTVLDHLSGAGSAPPLWLTGSRGSGKTAVLGRIATTATSDLRARLPVVARQGVLPVGDLALAPVDARGRTADRLAAEIARLLRLTAAESVADLLAGLGGANGGNGGSGGGSGGSGGTVRGVIVDHVDEADGPDAVLADLVGPLAALPDVRVVLGAARPLPGHPAGLAVDLDEPAHRGPAAVAAYLRTRLEYGAPDAPGGRGGRGAPEAVAALERICGGCFAAAVAAADVLVRDRVDPLDRASEAAVERLDRLLRRTLGELLPQPVADAAVDVLTALCSFHDDLFLDVPTWAAVTARRARTPVGAGELEACLAACRTFLERRDATVRAPGRSPRAVRAVLRQLLDEIGPEAVGFSGWERVAPHLLDILAAAAADPAGDVDRLLDDPGFLLALPRPTMTRTVKALHGPEQAARAAVWNAQPRQAEPHQRRFALALAATRRGLADLAQAVGPVAAPCGSLEVRWARPAARERHTTTRVCVTGSPGPGSAGPGSVITAHDDGTLVWWDGGSGEQGPSRQVADSRVVALHALDTADGADALLVLADGSVLRCAPDADRVPDQVLRTGKGERPGPSAGHPAGFLALGDGPAVEVLAVGPAGGDLEPVGREPFRQTVVATALAGPPDDPVLWAATLDGVVHRWSPAAPGAPRRVALCPNPVRLAAAADGETAVIVDADGNCTFVGGAAALAGAVPALRRNLRAVELTADWFVVAGGDGDGYGQGYGPGGGGGNWLDTYSVTDGSGARWPLDGLPTGISSHGPADLVVVTSRAPALLRARTDPKHGVSQHRSAQHGMSQHGRRR
ncbi:ATP-binding protein [Streptomyces sp. NPDC050263]|uniref:ATP-binding protein n=1 Tax=Streptomyces sp. NPDC050263 TaxID=3155037 RepID=UPI0034289021